jgi:hypothetical protein
MTDKKYPMVLMESLHRGKGVYRDSESIDDMIHNLGAQIAYLEDLQELGVEMVSDKGIEDDYITLTKEVKEDSEEFEELKERGFVKVEFDKEGRKLA